MQVQEIMTPDPEIIDPNATMRDAARKMRADNLGVQGDLAPFDRVFTCTVMVADMADWPILNQVYGPSSSSATPSPDRTDGLPRRIRHASGSLSGNDQPVPKLDAQTEEP
jgi:CBS domain-containing protein